MDVKTTFLHGELDETTYTKPPDGFIKEGTENQICLLKRSLRGLKQSLRMWYTRFEKPIYLWLYADDMLLAN